MSGTQARLLACVGVMLSGAMIMLSANQLAGEATRNLAAGGFFIFIVSGIAGFIEYLRCQGD